MAGNVYTSPFISKISVSTDSYPPTKNFNSSRNGNYCMTLPLCPVVICYTSYNLSDQSCTMIRLY